MRIFLSASPASWLRSDDTLQVALNHLRALPGHDLTVIRHDPTYGHRVQDTSREMVASADLVVADMRGGHSVVALEVGYALGLGKPVILIAEDSSEIPFDFRDSRAIIAPPSAPDSYLAANLADALSDVLPDSARKTLKGARAKTPRTSVFISYSHADTEYLSRILVHLQPLQRDGLLEAWSDLRLYAGDDWRAQIRQAMDKAAVAVLIISADFLASEFIATDELPPLLAAAEGKGTRIIPVIAKPSRFARDPRLNRFQAMNDPKRPMVLMSEADREQLFANLAESIEVGLGLASP